MGRTGFGNAFRHLKIKNIPASLKGAFRGKHRNAVNQQPPARHGRQHAKFPRAAHYSLAGLVAGIGFAA
ncbi:hypothetical protein D3C71_1485950 [compost metagenome]